MSISTALCKHHHYLILEHHLSPQRSMAPSSSTHHLSLSSSHQCSVSLVGWLWTFNILVTWCVTASFHGAQTSPSSGRTPEAAQLVLTWINKTPISFFSPTYSHSHVEMVTFEYLVGMVTCDVHVSFKKTKFHGWKLSSIKFHARDVIFLLIFWSVILEHQLCDSRITLVLKPLGMKFF